MLVAGVDEAGRGPLAGPVVAAAVILPEHHGIEDLTDSKKMTAKRRDVTFRAIHERALAVGVGSATREEIDEINILHASMLAMQRAVEGLAIVPDAVWCDGNRCPVLSVPTTAIIRGDASVACISAASIVAKVSRDRLMVDLHARYPHYGFDSHKGYPTKLHRLALQKYGPISEHRRSFGPVRRYFETEDH
jgi:ribonuclease HII